MSDITDAQTIATYNAEGQALPAAIAPKTGDAAVQTVVSGTAFQISSRRSADLYINITTAAALKVEIGPTSAAAIQLSTSQSSALGLMSLHIPAGWYVKLTGTVTDYVVTAVLL